MLKNLKESALFFAKFLKSPLQQASITPSSKFSGKAMIKKIDFSTISSIIELGPGNGVFTKEILKKCRPDTKVILIEIDEKYVGILKEKFLNRVYIENISVHRMDEIIAKHQIDKIDLIISGLPFLPKDIKQVTERLIKEQIEKGTIFRLFTYMPPIMKKVYKNFNTRHIAFVFRNIPPLWVYELK
jgi:phosphatidylethanolamine/phosphatidyl-N-methylethanolamine N-methyltransferase